ncbi:pyridoxamine 5'-phosphate oxidase family protein, partial [Mediterraneibacter gnavus]
MDTLKEFQKMMAEQTDLALATVGTDGIPNVRIVNYYFNPENNIVYFATFKNNEKVK